MTRDTLAFTVRSGGTVTIDVNKCGACETRACLIVCDAQGGPLVLDESRGVPTLRWPVEEIERGGCVECLGCELACDLEGRQAVAITLPLAGFDEYLETLTEPLVYERER